MNIATAAGRVLIAGFAAGPVPQELTDLAARGRLGGFILFRRNVEGCEQVATLNRTLCAAFPAERAPLVAVDQEGGRVRRIGPPLLQLPPMRSLGTLDDPDFTRRLAETMGRQLRALGFNIDMAPVLDVDSNPDNPVIGDRSFGDTSARVIRHGRALAEGLLHAGLAACGKHFPGHGDTSIDSHFSLPRVSHERAHLDAVELRPFAALTRTLPCIMSSHIVFDALAPETPATLAKPIMTSLLRQTLGFRGIVFTDDMEMRAVADNYGVENAACMAIAAGCDALLICSRVDWTLRCHAALIRRAETNSAFADRLLEAAQRVEVLARCFPCAPLSDGALRAALEDQRAQQLESELERRLRTHNL